MGSKLSVDDAFAVTDEASYAAALLLLEGLWLSEDGEENRLLHLMAERIDAYEWTTSTLRVRSGHVDEAS